MSAKLPEPIAAYFEAANAQDIDGVAACVSDDAVVRDEGREWRGIVAIREWAEEASRKYRPTANVIDEAVMAGKTIAMARVSGNFPGSPVELLYVFTLGGEKIARLEILS
jgi:hypothetical protein